MEIKLTPIPQISDREATQHEVLLLQLLQERDEYIDRLSDDKDLGYTIAAIFPLLAFCAGLVLVLTGAFGRIESEPRGILLQTGSGLILGGGTATGLAQKRR